MTAIKLSKVKYSWPGSNEEILNIPFWEIKKGQKIFLEGPSGSGKTTLLSIISGILASTEGTVEVLSNKLNSFSSAKRDQFRADHLGYIFQMFNLIPYLSVYENILLPLQFSKKKSQRYANKQLINDDINRIIDNLKITMNLLHKPISELSVGQQQRVSVARALIGKPALIIADEPTSALDYKNRESFINLLLQECEVNKTTVVFVSHDPTLSSYFDQNIQMEKINVSNY